MKALLPLAGLIATAGFLAYTNYPLEQPERLLYSVLDLGEGCRPIAINNRGEVLLRTEEGNSIRRPDGSIEPIRIQLGEPHVLLSMNDQGEVLGRSNTNRERETCFIWSRDGGLRVLPKRVGLGNDVHGEMVDVHSLSNEGAIAITIHNEAGYERAILMSKGEVQTVSSRSVPRLSPGGSLLFRRSMLLSDKRTDELPRNIERRYTPTEKESYRIYPVGLNDHGEVVGFAYPSDSDYRRARMRMQNRDESTRGDLPPELPEAGFPFIRLVHEFLNLNLCIPPDTHATLRWPIDLNNQGQIVGHALVGDTPMGVLLEPIDGGGVGG